MRMIPWTKQLPVALSAVALSMAPRAAWACAVCYGAPGAPQTHGMNLGIITMLGVTGIVLGGFGSLFVCFARRARRHSAELIP